MHEFGSKRRGERRDASHDEEDRTVTARLWLAVVSRYRAPADGAASQMHSISQVHSTSQMHPQALTPPPPVPRAPQNVGPSGWVEGSRCFWPRWMLQRHTKETRSKRVGRTCTACRQVLRLRRRVGGMHNPPAREVHTPPPPPPRALSTQPDHNLSTAHDHDPSTPPGHDYSTLPDHDYSTLPDHDYSTPPYHD